MSSLSLRGLAKRHPSGAGLLPLDLDLPAGDRLVLLGPSGAGKSTLLRLIAGLDDPDAGEVQVGGVNVTRLPPHKRNVGFVPQRPALYPQLTVKENLLASGGRQPAVEVRLEESAALLNLSHLLDRRPHELSGGEKQRVALARLAVRRPGVWLLDEPFAPLDPAFRSEFRHDLHLLAAAAAATILVVTHDPSDALALGRRVGVLVSGSLRQLGPPEELHDRPGNRFVAEALGRFVFLPGELVGRADASFGVRPEDVRPLPPGEVPAAAALFRRWPVVSAEPTPGGWVLTMAMGRARLKAAHPGPPPAAGTLTDWYVPESRGVLFDDVTGNRVGG